MDAVSAAPRREIQVVGLITLAHMLSHFYFLALAPLYPLIQPDLGVSWSGIGLGITAFAVTTGVLQTPVGFLVDRVGGRKVLIGGMFLMAGAVGLIGLVENIWQFAALMALSGVGSSVFHPADYSLISAAVEDKRLGRAFSIHTLGGHLGFVSAPIVIVALESVLGWRGALMSVGAVGVVVALVILAFSSVLGEGGGTRKKTGDCPGWRTLLSSKQLLLMFVFFVGASGANSGIINFSVKALGDIYGLPLAAAAVALTTYQVAILLAVLPGGWLADRARRHDLLLATCFTISGAMVILAGLGALPFWLVLVVLAVGGGLRGLVNASRDVSVRRVAGDHSVGTAFAFVSTGFLLGQAIAPPIYGYLIDVGEPVTIFWTSAAFSLVSVATILIARQRI